MSASNRSGAERNESARALARSGIALLLAWLPFLLGRGWLAYVGGRYAGTLGAADALLVFGLTPVVVLSAFVVYLTPGGLLVAGLLRPRGCCDFLLKTAALALVVGGLELAAGVLALGAPLDGGSMMMLHVGVSLAAALPLALRSPRAGGSGVIAGPIDRRRALQLAAAIACLCAALLPKLFWENFNGDGLEAFEFGRSLTRQLFPYWKLGAETSGFYPNFFLFAYPNAWLIALAGPIEAAARLPFLLYVGLIFCGLSLLIEHASPRRLAAREEGLLWLGIAVFVVATCFNISYDPYFADIAEPAATDALLVACFLAALYAFWTLQLGWFVLFALFSHWSSPAGLLLLGLACPLTILLCDRARRARAGLLGAAGLALAGVVLAYELVYLPQLGTSSVELSAGGLVRKLADLRFVEYSRAMYLVLPCGILPALSLFALRRQDALARCVSLTAFLYFALMYVRAFVPNHNFVPVFTLPLVVFWRLRLTLPPGFGRWLDPAVGLLALLALWLSLPLHFQLNQSVRSLGARTAFGVGNYEGDYDRALSAALVLKRAIRPTYALRDPAAEWGTSPYPWLFYALRHEAVPAREIDYVVSPPERAPPRGFRELGRQRGAVLFVRDTQTWHSDRFQRLPVPYRRWPYALENRHQFRHLAGESYAIALEDLVPAALRPAVARLVGRAD